MTRFLFLLTFLCFASKNTLAQDQTLDSAEYKRVYETDWAAFGFQYNQHSNLWSKSAELYSNRHFSNNLNSVSFTLFGPSNYMEDFAIAIDYYLPTTLHIDDSTTYQTTGFGWRQPLYPAGLDLLYWAPQKNNFQYDLPLFISLGIGSLYLKEQQNKYRNFFFTFDLHINPRIVLFKHLVLGGYANLSWDVTKDRWKNKNDLSLPFVHKHTQMSYGFTIGWIIRNSNSYVRIY